MKRLLRVLAAVIVALLVLLMTIGMLFRSGSDRVMNGIKIFNKRFLNPTMLRFAGSEGFYAAALHHAGRRSGRPYVTPVRAEPTPDGFVIPLPYGTDVDWLKNVLAAGEATLVTRGTTVGVDRPQVIPAAEAGRYLPVRLRRQLDGYGVDEYLRLHATDPNALTDRPPS